MPFCPECGKEINTNEKFCYSCGKTISRHGSVYSENKKNVLKVPLGQSEIVSEEEGVEDENQSFELTEQDEFTLHKLKLFAILEIFGFGIVLSVLIVKGFGIMGSDGIPSIVDQSIQSRLVLVLIPIGILLCIVSTYQVRNAFASLSEIDEKQFSRIRQLMMPLIIGLGCFFVASILIVAALEKGINLSPLDYEIFAAPLVIGFFPSIIGGLSIALGLERIGQRYGSRLFKIGAVLLAFAFLGFFISTIVSIFACSISLILVILSSSNSDLTLNSPKIKSHENNTRPNYALIAVGAVFFVVGVALWFTGSNQLSAINSVFGDCSALQTCQTSESYEILGGILGFIGFCMMLGGLIRRNKN